ncbi:MAG TPA: DUF1697 domain-containing protein [Gemmatimonadaceae bacterium]|nr:DUF1697 domain-containing protein [Gemmatimonadaceae bacterium]
MSRWVALLRAINVGGHVVKMDRLRTLFEELDFTDVETVIASGNVLFSSSARSAGALEERIERHLASALGYAVTTFIRTPDEMGAVAAFDPFPGAVEDGHTLSVAFLKQHPGSQVAERLHGMRTDYDELRVVGRELYWLARGRMSDSKVWRTPMEKVLEGPATSRNVTTVRKLAEKLAAS